MNRAFLIGRLTREPELRATGSGIAVCTFTLAVDRRFANKDTQTREA
ncbi:MAG: single-stranded DNA-binding protein, partial [Clostridia bacterium]|nr:single-stranded DNA-binding protein [Clostridia bacterium]